jgi:hypothetical protein
LALEARNRGWAGLQTPLIPYFDPRPFYRARFVPYPKKLVVVLMPFGDAPWTGAATRLHLDWR